MTTAMKTFKRAYRVERSNTGCYAFRGQEIFFDDAISYDGREFDWEIVEELTGWGPWTHAVVVRYGDESVHYFAR